MPFSPEDRKSLLSLHGVGPTVLSRLEEMGYSTLSQLAKADVDTILAQGAQITGSSCWKNSPRSKEAISAVINAARDVNRRSP